MVSHRRSVLFVLVALAVLGSAAAGYALSTSNAPRMGPARRISRKAFEGYYDGHKDTYLNTDVSSRADAASMHINFAPALKAMPLASSPEMYLVEGRAPIWKETILTWQPSATPVRIKSDTQIDQLEKKGELSERATSTRLNCPIVKVRSG